jgi:ParB-like chromosome segregation protein Spo0J
MNKPVPNYKMVNTADLIPYARNSRTHSEAQVGKIAASIKEFGFLNPIIVDGESGIIAGHGRILAAQKLGLQQVPCIEAAHLTEAQKRAYVIADNRLALDAGWDNDLLKIELQDLDAQGFDLSLTGFEVGEIDAFLTNAQALEEYPELPDGDRQPFQQMTFTLHDEQVDAVKAALEVSKAVGPFVETQNENGNGNALARICETYVTQNVS